LVNGRRNNRPFSFAARIDARRIGAQAKALAHNGLSAFSFAQSRPLEKRGVVRGNRMPRKARP
jgi:hypothetical protein